MGTFKEIEVKYLLNKDDFYRLRDLFILEKMNSFVQTNHYFDTPNKDLLNNGISLRVRAYETYYEATVKVRNKEYNFEYNEIITQEEFIYLCAGDGIVDGKVDDIIRKFNINIKDIIKIGQLRTERSSIKYLDGELFFDVNYYNNLEDYEIEYEVNTSKEEATKVLLKLFNDNNITSYSLAKGKVHRATEI